MKKDFQRILFEERTIRSAIRKIARRLDRDYAGKTPVMVGVLKGAVFFLVHLVQEMDIPLEIEFVQVSSYGNGVQSSGRLRSGLKTAFDPAGRHVLLVDDVLDTGLTLSRLCSFFRKRGAASVRTVVLFDKKAARKIPIEADYAALPAPDEWLTGWGLDSNGLYRQSRVVGVLKKIRIHDDRS